MSEVSKNIDRRKRQIANRFGNAASYYECYASVQKEAAERLIASLEPWRGILPSGPILEVGCGTGFVTEGLLELFPSREIRSVDISPEMIHFCEEKFSGIDNLTFARRDAEALTVRDQPQYAMTISGFAAQWFKDPYLTLGRFLELTKPGGLLLASFPGHECFPEWKEACVELGLPFTRNPLPDTEEMVIKMSGGPVQVDFYEDRIKQEFDSSVDFFRHIKKLGAGTQEQGRHLSPAQMKMLIDHWDSRSDGPVQVSWHVVFLAVKRNYDS